MSDSTKCGSLIRSVSSDPCEAFVDGLDGLCSGCREFKAMCEQHDAAVESSQAGEIVQTCSVPSSAAGGDASEQGRFAARAFIARYVREAGQAPPAEFSYEVGYLRGRSDGAREAMKMFDEITRAREEARKGNNDDTK